MAEASDFKFGTPLGFQRPVIKSYPAEKVGVALGLGSSPKFLGSLIFLQRPRCSLSVSGASCYYGLSIATADDPE